MKIEQIERLVAMQYAAVHASLSTDPEYVRLSVAAAAEEETTPDRWLDRNRLHMYVELHMPTA